MSIFAKNKSKEKLVIVFNISSSSVGAVFFYAGASLTPRVIFSTTEAIPLRDSVDGEALLDLTIKTLNVVGQRIHKANLATPDEIFCTLSSPWHMSQMRTIKLEKNVPFTFTPKLADELIKKEVALFEEEHMSKYKNAGSSMRLIELKNIKILLNGYETTSPVDKQGKSVEMNVFISIAEEQVLDKIQHAIQHYFYSDKVPFVRFVSAELALFTVVRDMASAESFLLVDIGGEITDISIVKNNILQGSSSFPVGMNSVIRKIAFALPASFSEAKSMLSLHEDMHAGDATNKKLENIFSLIKKEWLDNFEKSLALLAGDLSIPSLVYIKVDKNFSRFFGSAVASEQFSQYYLTQSKFKIVFLSTEMFNSMIQFTGPHPGDLALLVDCVYCNRFF